MFTNAVAIKEQEIHNEGSVRYPSKVFGTNGLPIVGRWFSSTKVNVD
jgi:hypothetical protein